jgi:hypothetical protein
MHFNRIPCEIKETRNNNPSFYLYHLLLSCFHILYELALEQNADAICCVFFFGARMEVDLITTSAEGANFLNTLGFNSISSVVAC